MEQTNNNICFVCLPTHISFFNSDTLCVHSMTMDIVENMTSVCLLLLFFLLRKCPCHKRSICPSDGENNTEVKAFTEYARVLTAKTTFSNVIYYASHGPLTLFHSIFISLSLSLSLSSTLLISGYHLFNFFYSRLDKVTVIVQFPYHVRCIFN